MPAKGNIPFKESQKYLHPHLLFGLWLVKLPWTNTKVIHQHSFIYTCTLYRDFHCTVSPALSSWLPWASYNIASADHRLRTNQLYSVQSDKTGHQLTEQQLIILSPLVPPGLNLKPPHNRNWNLIAGMCRFFPHKSFFGGGGLPVAMVYYACLATPCINEFLTTFLFNEVAK